jgi:hypothetical protein
LNNYSSSEGPNLNKLLKARGGDAKEEIKKKDYKREERSKTKETKKN